MVRIILYGMNNCFFTACSGLALPDYWEALSNNESMSSLMMNPA